MFLIYDFIFIIFIIVYFPYLFIKRKWHKDIISRFGIFTKLQESKIKGEKNIWIHAVSVGEVMAVAGLLNKIRQAYPDFKIICSTSTKTGNNLAQKIFNQEALIIYSPLDLSWVVRRYIKVINPRVYISAETEIWPNLYTALNRRKIPIVQVNGRISPKAFLGYKRVQFLLKPALDSVSIFCMQSRIDADRIISLGAQAHKVEIVGNLKFDALSPVNHLRKEDFGFSEDDILFVAGSTHPGEETIIIDSYKELCVVFENMRLVIAPRHIERADEVFDLAKKNHLNPLKYSTMVSGQLMDNSVLIIDTIGHLRGLYSVAGVVFIGKTFTVGGGQNMIEPVFFGKPTIVGPHTENFKSVVDLFLQEKIIIQIDHPDNLTSVIISLMKSPQQIKDIAKNSKEIIKKHQGAIEKTLGALDEFINK